MTKLILIEGIPGSGKTTYAQRIEKYLNETGLKSKCILEGELHPADFAWCGIFSEEEFIQLKQLYPDYSTQLDRVSARENNKFIIPYLELTPRNKKLISYIEQREPYSGRVSADEFMSLNLERWLTFSKKAMSGEQIYIFESVFLQNNINELMLFHNSSYEYVLKYIREISDSVRCLDPILIYFEQSDVRETINRVANSRISRYKDSPGWIDRVNEYIASSPYGKHNGLSESNATVEYMKIRAGLEKNIIKELGIRNFNILNTGFEWDDMFMQIRTYINDCI